MEYQVEKVNLKTSYDKEVKNFENFVFSEPPFEKIDSIPRHPSQIYEAFLEGVLLFLILQLIIKKASYKRGECAAIFLIFYSIFRIFSEFFREPDLQIGYIFNYVSMGSLLSFFMFGLGIVMYLKIK